MYDILWYIYRIPMSFVPFICVMLSLLWGVFNGFFYKKNPIFTKIFNLVLFILYSAFILYFTVFSRGKGNYAVYLNPFNNIINSFEDKDFLRSMIMNMFLFTPLGSFCSVCLLSFKKSFSVFCVIVVLFSLCVEILQYFLQVGVFETNDIMMNFIGGLIGYLSLIIYKKSGGNNEQ